MQMNVLKTMVDVTIIALILLEATSAHADLAIAWQARDSAVYVRENSCFVGI